MKMTPIEVLWQAIRQEVIKEPLSEGEFRLVRYDSCHPFDIYAGVDSTGSVMLALGVTKRPPAIDAETGALNYLRKQRASGSWLMALRLTGTGLEQVFGRLCQDMIDAALNVGTETALVSLFKERLLLWMRLFRDGGTGLLQKFQIKGLIAELLALEGFLVQFKSDPALPVMAWLGPAGADQDFLFADCAVEVKAVSPSADLVSISSAGQLHADVPLELRLYVLRDGSPSETAAFTLPLLVSRIEQIFPNRPDLLRVYRSKLIEAGFVDNDYYQSVAFTLTECRRYSVRDDFPRLIKPSLPDAIASVTYSLQLSSIAPFQLLEITDAT